MKTASLLLTASLSLSSLSTVMAAEQALQLTPAASIEIPSSKGKFDFLRIDSKRGRLLAAHENDGTSDFIDLKKSTLISRVKVGGPVDTAVDNDSKFYYVSVQDPERVAAQARAREPHEPLDVIFFRSDSITLWLIAIALRALRELRGKA